MIEDEEGDLGWTLEETFPCAVLGTIGTIGSIAVLVMAAVGFFK